MNGMNDRDEAHRMTHDNHLHVSPVQPVPLPRSIQQGYLREKFKRAVELCIKKSQCRSIIVIASAHEAAKWCEDQNIDKQWDVYYLNDLNIDALLGFYSIEHAYVVRPPGSKLNLNVEIAFRSYVARKGMKVYEWR